MPNYDDEPGPGDFAGARLLGTIPISSVRRPPVGRAELLAERYSKGLDLYTGEELTGRDKRNSERDRGVAPPPGKWRGGRPRPTETFPQEASYEPETAPPGPVTPSAEALAAEAEFQSKFGDQVHF